MVEILAFGRRRRRMIEQGSSLGCLRKFGIFHERLYNFLMTNDHASPPDSKYVLAIGYLTILGVSLLGISFLESGIQRGLALGLLVVYGVLFALSTKFEKVIWRLRGYFFVQTIIVSILVLLKPNSGIFLMLFFMLSAQAMVSFRKQEGYTWVGIFTAATAIILIASFPLRDGLLILLPYATGYWFFSAFAQALAVAEQSRKESQTLLNELQAAHQQLQEYADQVEELAVSEERNRLAREMHDTLGHRLTVAAVQLEGAQRLIAADPDRAEEMVTTVRDQVRDALGELRSTVATLREPIQTDLSLDSALKRLVASFEGATDLKVVLTLPNEEYTVPDAHRLTIYRAAQEALTNVQRHAQAQKVWIDLAYTSEQVALTVRDDGTGVAQEIDSASFGLRGIRERAMQLGGEVHFANRFEGGAMLKVVLPLVEEARA